MSPEPKMYISVRGAQICHFKTLTHKPCLSSVDTLPMWLTEKAPTPPDDDHLLPTDTSEVQGINPPNSQLTSSPSESQTQLLDQAVFALTQDKLKDWIKYHNLPFAGSKKLKEDLIDLIATSGGDSTRTRRALMK
ncbi:hypothetical protein SERLADRAFT_411076 [Serpula lacrymans var. lacrymans S7.9]|uniref:Uncharacterized protein n=1 Tax=Serpula lacrymans var. lacrymans (strain S7.9) TaxID=578457 RepID=F8P8X5_SERL9|nr:uncharacterized protein SERLADRAFT_411076 [Serpula lacrymans var. lacrymans S7.9]EGO20104.1 hypothetical protein SERLADRAFT_411076 [Serpula lacrymans var. lacrymans S7.9]